MTFVLIMVFLGLCILTLAGMGLIFYFAMRVNQKDEKIRDQKRQEEKKIQERKSS